MHNDSIYLLFSIYFLLNQARTLLPQGKCFATLRQAPDKGAQQKGLEETEYEL